MQRDELGAWLRLLLAPGVGRTAARRLLAAFGLPQQVLAQSADALAALLPAAQVAALREPPPGWDRQVDRTLAWLAAAPAGTGRRLIALGDPAYPADLLHTEDPPLLLHAWGQVPAQWPRAIAVVGSRNPTAQGAIDARRFAGTFAQAGWTVVSGLALGIDAAAHRGALDGAPAGQLATIAVVGTGLDRVYPPQHEALAQEIARHGLLLSEYPLGTGPLPANFPQRNRLISGLAAGTLVVEAALRSGSLITARMAAEQGREVYAIPGSIHSAQSRGCHQLLRQGAKLVETAQDVLEDLAPGTAAPATPSPAPAPVADPPLLQALGHDPVSLDALVARTGEAAGVLAARLLELELAGEVARLPGGLYQRITSG